MSFSKPKLPPPSTPTRAFIPPSPVDQSALQARERQRQKSLAAYGLSGFVASRNKTFGGLRVAPTSQRTLFGGA